MTETTHSESLKPAPEPKSKKSHKDEDRRRKKSKDAKGFQQNHVWHEEHFKGGGIKVEAANEADANNTHYDEDTLTEEEGEKIVEVYNVIEMMEDVTTHEDPRVEYHMDPNVTSSAKLGFATNLATIAGSAFLAKFLSSC